MNAFLAARERLEQGQGALSAGLDKQELALIEKNEGKNERWHVRSLAIAAKAAVNAVPRRQTPEEMTAFSAAIVSYGAAVRDFDDFNKTAGKSDQSNPRTFLAGLRELRDKIEKKQASQTDFRNIIGQYNAVVDMVNSYQ